MPTDPTFDVIVDVPTRRPACVLIQAALGGDRSIVSRHFEPKTWLTAPTQTMRLVRGTDAQWRQIAALANAQDVPNAD